jgi:hypothetical protein
MADPPSKKVTVPVGEPDPGACGVTLAVSVTSCSSDEGEGVAVSDVLVAAFATSCVVVPVLAAKFALPK